MRASSACSDDPYLKMNVALAQPSGRPFCGVLEMVTTFRCSSRFITDVSNKPCILCIQATAYSDDPGPLIPKEVGRLFRLKATTYSDAIRHPVGAKRRWVF
jgi:hypothetical protein